MKDWNEFEMGAVLFPFEKKRAKRNGKTQR